MSRVIRINNCSECFYKDHSGGFGQVAYKPRCTKTDKSRTLPYTEQASHGRVVALIKDGIPSWCPLEKE